MKKSFILYQDQEEIIDSLTNEKAGRLFKAIFDYARGDKPNLGQNLSIVFISIRQAIDRAKENYEKVCETNSQNAKKRWNKIDKLSDGIRTHTNVNDSDNDNVNDNESKHTNIPSIGEKVFTPKQQDEIWKLLNQASDKEIERQRNSR